MNKHVIKNKCVYGRACQSKGSESTAVCLILHGGGRPRAEAELGATRALQDLFSKRRTFSTNFYSCSDITNIHKERLGPESKIQRLWQCHHMSAPTFQPGLSSEMLKPSWVSECMHRQGHLGVSLARMHLFCKEK